MSTTACDPAAWHDLGTSIAGASGALLGLAFVAISFNLDAILKDKQLSGRAVETLIFFACPLAGSLLIQVPGLSERAAGSDKQSSPPASPPSRSPTSPAGKASPTTPAAGG
jgi:hypothetical protein